MEVWIIRDGMGEYVRYYNPTGSVMVFTRDSREAYRTNDSAYAFEISRIARSLYNRPQMSISLE